MESQEVTLVMRDGTLERATLHYRERNLDKVISAMVVDNVVAVLIKEKKPINAEQIDKP